MCIFQLKEPVYYDFEQNQPQPKDTYISTMYVDKTNKLLLLSINYPSTNMFIKMTSLHFKIQFSNIYL